MLVANVVLQTFQHGGWIMWPVVATFFLALCVLLERTYWWITLKRSIRPDAQEQAREALGTGNFAVAWQLGQQMQDPFLHNLNEGISHAHTSMLAAMHLHATKWIERSEARMWILGTIITLAPLLGLLGTVVGLMGSFSKLGDDALQVSAITGGIGEALIATSWGLAIAIGCLLPYNFFRKRVSAFRGAFENWINHAELLVQSAKAHGHDIEAYAVERHLKR